MSMCDWPGDTLADDEGTETTRTPSRAGVTVSESDESLDIDTLLLKRFAETGGSPVALDVVALIPAGNSSDGMPEAELPLDEDVLLTACTSSMVFCADELLPTGRLDSTRLLLDADITRVLLLLLLTGKCLRMDDDSSDASDGGDARTTEHQSQ